MINKTQKQILLSQGWTIEETIDGVVLNFNGNWNAKDVKHRDFFRKANFLGITKLWMEEDEDLLETISRYRNQYGYGDRFINNILDEDDCILDLRRNDVSYTEIIDGLIEYDEVLEKLFNKLDERIEN